MDHDTHRLVSLPQAQWAIALAALRVLGELRSDYGSGECARVAAVGEEIMRQIQRQIDTDIRKKEANNL